MMYWYGEKQDLCVTIVPKTLCTKKDTFNVGDDQMFLTVFSFKLHANFSYRKPVLAYVIH